MEGIVFPKATTNLFRLFIPKRKMDPMVATMRGFLCVAPAWERLLEMRLEEKTLSPDAFSIQVGVVKCTLAWWQGPDHKELIQLKDTTFAETWWRDVNTFTTEELAMFYTEAAMEYGWR